MMETILLFSQEPHGVTSKWTAFFRYMYAKHQFRNASPARTPTHKGAQSPWQHSRAQIWGANELIHGAVGVAAGATIDMRPGSSPRLPPRIWGPQS
jgi:hypothetical protein